MAMEEDIVIVKTGLSPESGIWVCDGCGEEMPGEQIEPPAHHIHECDEASNGSDLTFVTEDGEVKYGNR